MRAVELGPDHSVARLNLGYALLDSGRAADARDHFDYVAARERTLAYRAHGGGFGKLR